MTDLRTRLEAVAAADVDQLVRKDAEYGSSWKKRGGVDSYFMLCRKWDRIEVAVQRQGWNILEAAAADTREEGLLDDIGDLRRYLMLVEQEVRARQRKDPLTGVSATTEVLYGAAGNGLHRAGPPRAAGNGTEHPAPFGYDPALDGPEGVGGDR